MRPWLFAVGLVAVNAWALVPGAPLYAAAPQVAVLAAPSAKAKVVLTLKRGDEVRWLGVSAKDTSFHEVERDGKKGFVHLGDLAPAKPQLELTSQGNAIDPAAFAAAGAATSKPTFGPGSTSSANSPEEKVVLEQLEQLEAMNAAAATPAALAKKRKELAGQR